MTADGLVGGGEKTVETGGRIRDLTEKLIGEIFYTRGQGTQVGIKQHR